MINILAVAAGGAVGSVARYLLMGRVALWLGTAFPWGTLAVNVIGCAIYGMLVEVFARKWSAGGEVQALLFVGFLGGFTTFSAFSFDVYVLYERGAVAEAAIYVIASVALSVLGLFAGLHLLRSLLA
ncbi:MAG: fluoride efflux transporter CrcB [Alphaproteobacteria bacterium]|nr:fluoride efflux transporter CrcB [Alphaproteobacteria bacterium]